MAVYWDNKKFLDESSRTMPQLDILPGASLPQDLQAIIEAAPIANLDGSPRDPDTVAAIQRAMQSSNLAGTLIESALWLLAGDLERSHTISQQYDSREGSYWHGIMHRREGDYSNAKYWFRRVGDHPVLSRLRQQIQSHLSEFEGRGVPVSDLLASDWLAGELVDQCQSAVRHGDLQQPDLQRITWWEWQLLLEHCI
ncbi:MAG: hypothetical protein D6753_12805 [Planctomycetota bacterium]|nr:MAG: hypothetical protein D6753_12805 [Planctomycetota bacterium]